MKKLMTKEEIINSSHFKVWYDENGNEVMLKEHCLNAMEEYAQQDKETCKWTTIPNTDDFCIPGCNKTDWTKMIHLYDFQYCPFCGRKIERV